MTKGQMTYIGEAGLTGARKYVGQNAAEYDKKRQDSPKWKAEQAILEGLIAEIPEGALVLDCPVGTGRLVPAFKGARLNWVGVDTSSDMLKEVMSKFPDSEDNLEKGSIFDIKTPDRYFHTSFMIRLTRWLNDAERTKAIQELCRATDKRVVFTARVNKHSLAYTMEQINADVPEGWGISSAQIGEDPYYRMIVLDRV